MSSAGYVAAGAAALAFIALARTTPRAQTSAAVEEEFEAAPTVGHMTAASGVAVGEHAPAELAVPEVPGGDLFVARFRRVVEDALPHPQAATFNSLTRRELMARFVRLDPPIRAAVWSVEGHEVALPWDVRPEDPSPIAQPGLPESNIEWWARGAPTQGAAIVTDRTRYPWGTARPFTSGEVAADVIQGDLEDYFGVTLLRDGAKAVGGFVKGLF